MIEINLIPDVKLELLKAKQTRTAVISASILTSIVAGGIVALLVAYVYGVQGVANWSVSNSIDKQSKQLKSVKDLPEMLTIQNQLGQLSSTGDKKQVTSRMFDLIDTIIPEGKNKVSISKIDLNIEDNTITLDASTSNGYEALEVFRKTVAATTFRYTTDNKPHDPIQLASNIQDSDRKFGEDTDGAKVLRFTMTFNYAPESFAPSSVNGKFIGPNKQNATDSARSVPKSIFTDAPKDEEAK